MAHHDALDNSPKKEFLTALIGVGLFLLIVGGIAVSAWVRPAGDHYPVTAEPEATLVNAESTGVAPAQAENAGVDNLTDPIVGTQGSQTPSAAPEITDSTTAPEDTDSQSTDTTQSN